MSPGTITIGIDPTIEIGPVTLAWHGLTIAIGILVGGLLAGRVARERGLDPAPLQAVGLILTVAGIIGARIFYLVETDPASLLRPAQWVGTRGFTFNGGLVLAAVAIGLYLNRRRLSTSYLDAVAVAFPLGVAIGRLGDVINGEHYGPPTDFLLGVRNTHPDADVPSPEVAYHSGGLYEVLLGAAIFALVWPLRHRLRRPLSPVWLVMALFAVGRFFVFFVRSDSDEATLGLTSAQWTSVALLVAAALGALVTVATARPRRTFGGSASPSVVAIRSSPAQEDDVRPVGQTMRGAEGARLVRARRLKLTRRRQRSVQLMAGVAAALKLVLLVLLVLLIGAFALSLLALATELA